MAKVLDLKNDNEYNKLKEAAQIIKNCGLVLFPTETVYGLGANGLDENAVKKIYIAKGRNENNPINLLVSNMEMINNIAKHISDLEYKLMESFFPGPFTIILKKKSIVPSIVTANGDTVGVRMPSGIIAKELVELAGVPIAAPSANISGKPSGTNFNDIYSDFKDKVDYMIDGGDSSIGIESTIVKVIDNIPHILRPGSITDEQIEKIAGTIIKDYENSVSNLPSSNYDHYTLNSKSLLVISNDNEKMVSKINEIANTYSFPVFISTVGIEIGIFMSLIFVICFNFAHSKIASSIFLPENIPLPNILLVDRRFPIKYLGSVFSISFAKYLNNKYFKNSTKSCPKYF